MARKVPARERQMVLKLVAALYAGEPQEAKKRPPTPEGRRGKLTVLRTA